MLYHIIITSDCPNCKLSLKYNLTHHKSNECKCPGCKKNFIVDKSIGIKYFTTFDILESDCPECNRRLIYSSEELKTGIADCPNCKREFLISESTNIFRASELNKLDELVNSAVQEDNYLQAYLLGEKFVNISLITLYDAKRKTSTSKTIGKIAGFGASLLTGGIGVEDIIIYPLVNKAVQSIIGLDLDQLFILIKKNLFLQLTALVLSGEIINYREIEVIYFNSYLLFALLNVSNQDELLELIDESINERGKSNYSKYELEGKLLAALHNTYELENELFNTMWSYLSRIAYVKDESNTELGKLLISIYNKTAYEEGDFNTESDTDDDSNLDRQLNEELCKEILGIKGTIKDMLQIKTAYRQKISKYHPDKFDTYDDDFINFANKKTQEVNDAYEFLKGKYNNHY